MNPSLEPTREEFLHISSPEKLLFYALIFLSLGYMVAQFAGRARLWLKGRPISPGNLRTGWRYWLPTGPALRRWAGNIWKYVLGQRKVRSSRPRSGAPMHLFIFYGFASLFLATTLLGINTYSPWKFHKGLYYEVYESTFDFMGLVFLAGILWALARRIWISRDRTARVVQETQLIDYVALVLLFVVGSTGYWVEAARISNVPKSWDGVSFVGFALARIQGPISDQGYRAIWWFHAALVMLLFAVLPKMRIRHIVNAIFVTAENPETPMGQLRLISMEEVEQTEQVGVKLAADFSRWHLMSLDACMECGRCTEVCPAWQSGKVLNPRQIVQDLRGAMATDEPVAGRVSEEALWQCTTCNACVEACPVLIRHVDLIVDVRRNLVSEGALSGSAATMLRQTASTGNAWGRSSSDREDWMKGLEIPLCRDGAPFDYLFWVGCAGATDPDAMRTTQAVAGLLKKAGISFACLGREEACTGDPARRVGEEFLFQDRASANVSVFERYKVKKLVTACPHCFNTLKNEYGELGASLEVFHHTQLLSELVSKGALVAATPAKGSVVLHDPCYLARVNEEIEAPRSLVVGMEAPPEQGKKTRCCGAGGGRMWMEEAPSQRPADKRTNALLETGASTVAVACPFCRIMLGDSIKQARPDDSVRLVDLAELLNEANS